MELSTLMAVKAEMRRFEGRLNAAIERVKKDNRDGFYPSGNREIGALKRGAMDLKMELTNITK